MALIRDFLTEVDAKWKPIGTEPITLQVIGSAALMLQCDYERGTKDGDVLEAKDGREEINEKLIVLRGRSLPSAGSSDSASDARARDVPRYLKNLHSVERDILGVSESEIDLPPECLPE